MKTSIKGNFRKYIFKSKENYVIGLFKVREISDIKQDEYANKTITFTGYFAELNEDDYYQFSGTFVNHPRYGIQFQVVEYERIKPEDKDTLLEFLSSGLFKGIGEKTAIKIIELLGNNCLELILNDHEVLLKVVGMTEKKAIKIHNSLIQYEESHNSIAYLFELGFTTKDALIIYNKYKSDTKNIVDKNIYQLIEDIDNINFMKVDALRSKMGIIANDSRRVKACIIFIINYICNNIGHTYLYEEEIITNSIKYLNTEIHNDEIRECIIELESEYKIIIVGNRHYLKTIYDAEMNIAKFLNYLSNIKCNNNKIASHIKKLETHFNLIYNDKQKTAIKKSIENHLLIINGGPGTGKTTIIKGIVELYKKINELNYEELINDVVLLAPTGRGAKRISESTLLKAVTIHRFLKWNKETNNFGINEYNKANVKFVIIDEASMIDTFLFDNLIKGLPKNVKLILVGDYNQLPSIGAGQVLKDLIESKALDVTLLEVLYRQKENSTIINLAYDVNNGETELDYLDNKDECVFVECKPYDIKKSVKHICQHQLNEGITNKQIQVLAPIYKGENGIDILNKVLQEVFNPKSPVKKELIVGDVLYREEDKVLQLVNLVDDNVFNGDIGVIKKIVTDNKKEIYIDFDGNIVKYNLSDLINIKHGYAISVHKSQGSEFDIVIMPMTNQYNRMLYRQLIYTGVTRAKKNLYLIGEKSALIKGISNNEINIRKTSLKELLINTKQKFEL